MSHTPGPWFANALGYGHVISDTAGYIVARGVPRFSQFTDGKTEEQANAQLIAAAPGLLEACEAALDEIMGEAYPVAARILASAIAKAKGADE